MGLQLVPKVLHDLPPHWDGRVVTWRGWKTLATTAEFHMKPQPCERCGSTETQATNGGMVNPLAGETVEAPRRNGIHKRSGRVRWVSVKIPAWPTLRLCVFRCPRCELDTVWDNETDQWWTLDPTDYGDEGSSEPFVETLW